MVRAALHRDPDARARWSFSAALSAMLPAALLVTVTLVDVVTPHPYYRFLAPLLVAVPALAAATSGVRGTVAFTAASIGVSFLLAQQDGMLFSRSFYGGLSGLIVIAVISLLPGHQRARRERKLAQVTSIAETVQRAVLVPIPEEIDSLRTAAAYVAAEEEARIGGDFYEALETPYGIRVIIGDVQGKGLPSVGSAANLLGAFREVAPHAADLPSLVARLEDSVRRHQARVGGSPGAFITATIVSIPPGPVAYLVCCGHPGPLVIRAGEVYEMQAGRPSLPLGLGDLSPGDYRVDAFDFAAGDRLVLYTDGVTEARSPDGEFYPLADRLAAWTDAQPEQLVKALVRDVLDFTGGRLGDDAALLTAQRPVPAGDAHRARDQRSPRQPGHQDLIRPVAVSGSSSRPPLAARPRVRGSRSPRNSASVPGDSNV